MSNASQSPGLRWLIGASVLLAVACSESGITVPEDRLAVTSVAAEDRDGERGGGRDDRRVRGVYGIGDRGERRGCRARSYREFDFWLGTWSITRPNGNPAGVSEISTRLDGCLIDEFYTGGAGRSISRYDRVSGQWHQDYVDNTGFTLRLFGGLDADGRMQMVDEVRPLGGGVALVSRFAWSQNGDGTVQQRWDFSTDGGANYFVNFNGRYARDPEYVAPPPPEPVACLARPADRALDGLVGRWRVRDSHGRTLGESRVTLGAATCLLEESFKGHDGYRMTAFIYRDRFVGAWFRTQVDNDGNTFRLGGPVTGTSVQMEGSAPGRPNSATPMRLSWDLAATGGPVQLWETQDASGEWREYARLNWVRMD